MMTQWDMQIICLLKVLFIICGGKQYADLTKSKPCISKPMFTLLITLKREPAPSRASTLYPKITLKTETEASK